MNTAVKLALTGSLLVAAWTVYSCPCDKACECKLTTFAVAAGVPLAYVVWDNL